MFKKTSCCCFALFCLTCVAAFGDDSTLQPPLPTEKASQLSFEQLREGIRESYQNLRAVDVTYVQIYQSIGPHLPAEPKIFPKMGFHFAFKGEQRLKMQEVKEAFQDSDISSPEMRLAFNGNEEQGYYPEWQEATIVSEKQEAIDSDPYLSALAIPLKDIERASAPETTYFLPEALDVAANEWSVRPTLEIVNGAECHVLESSLGQAIWVDPKAGFVMRYRELRAPVKSELSILSAKYCFTDFQEVANDIWLPTRIEIVSNYSSRAPKNLWNKPNYRVIHEVSKIAVNDDVDDSLFSLTFSPGTVVRDRVRNRWYRIGEMHEELEIVIDTSADILSDGSSRSRIWLIVINIAVVIAIISVFVYRRRMHSV